MKVRKSGRALFAAVLSVSAAMIAFSTSASAQSDTVPKYDVYLGYQWTHPGATVPAARLPAAVMPVTQCVDMGLALAVLLITPQ